MNSIIHTPTNKLAESLEFYSKLGFTKLPNTELELVSDGKVVIEINPDRFARAGIKLFSESWETIVEDVEQFANVLKIDNGYLLSDPSGIWIYLVESQEELGLDISGISPSVLGNNAGISLESTSINNSFHLWKLLGFTEQEGDIEQGWVTLRNSEGLVISLMKAQTCPHLFFNPSLTFFNGKNNLQIIKKIRSLKIPITEEITHFNKEGIVDNIIIRDPGGYGFFLFND
ncbi:MAG: hypothetical protein DRI71_01175 [Bacteroidetes bacterium]|nr:MAG: hypothetical protein DRI71_01175 [Bacteroidota bacterium]